MSEPVEIFPASMEPAPLYPRRFKTIGPKPGDGGRPRLVVMLNRALDDFELVEAQRANWVEAVQWNEITVAAGYEDSALTFYTESVFAIAEKAGAAAAAKRTRHEKLTSHAEQLTAELNAALNP